MSLKQKAEKVRGRRVEENQMQKKIPPKES